MFYPSSALLLSTFTLTSFADESIAGEPYVKKIDVSDLELFIPGILELQVIFH